MRGAAGRTDAVDATPTAGAMLRNDSRRTAGGGTVRLRVHEWGGEDPSHPAPTLSPLDQQESVSDQHSASHVSLGGGAAGERRGSVGSGSGAQAAPETARSAGGGDAGDQTHRSSARGRLATLGGSTGTLGQVVGVGGAGEDGDGAEGLQSPGRAGHAGGGHATETPRVGVAPGADGGSIHTDSVAEGAARGGGSIGGGDRGGGGGGGASVGGARGPTLQLLTEGLGLDDQIEQLLRISALADQEWEEGLAQLQGGGGGTPSTPHLTPAASP